MNKFLSNTTTHESFMRFAFREAEKGFNKGEVPIGCVIVFKNKIIAKSYNQVETLQDPTAHAEILAITSACDHLGTKFLEKCSLYTTLEPCPMCAGAIILARIENLYFGSYDLKSGACGSIINIVNNKYLNHKINSYGGILDEECSLILKTFFNRKKQGSN